MKEIKKKFYSLDDVSLVTTKEDWEEMGSIIGRARTEDEAVDKCYEFLIKKIPDIDELSVYVCIYDSLDYMRNRILGNILKFDIKELEKILKDFQDSVDKGDDEC